MVKRKKVEMAIEKGQIKQIEQFDDVSEGEDIIWLRGSNQGKEKCNTYLATKCNGLFEKSNNSEQGKYEMGMGVPETGNRYVKSVFMLHVGGTRCVTWSIDRIIQRHACITWGVEFIRAIFFIFFFYV